MNWKYAVRGKLELWEKRASRGVKRVLLGGGQFLRLSYCKGVRDRVCAQRVPGKETRRDKGRQFRGSWRAVLPCTYLAVSGGRVWQRNGHHLFNASGPAYPGTRDLLFTSRLLKKCFYPLSALTANLSLASGAGNGSIIREHTGKEPRAGKLSSDGCLPPPRLCGLSAAGEAARTAGEGLFHGLIWQCLYFIRVACFICIPSQAVFVLRFFLMTAALWLHLPT